MTDSPSGFVPASDSPAGDERWSTTVSRIFRHARRTAFAFLRAAGGLTALLVLIARFAYDRATALALVLIKVVGCVVAGTGVGLLAVGLFALKQPELWETQVLRRSGPPVAPVLVGGAICLLMSELLLLAVFRRGRRQPR